MKLFFLVLEVSVVGSNTVSVVDETATVCSWFEASVKYSIVFDAFLKVVEVGAEYNVGIFVDLSNGIVRVYLRCCHCKTQVSSYVAH